VQVSKQGNRARCGRTERSGDLVAQVLVARLASQGDGGGATRSSGIPYTPYRPRLVPYPISADPADPRHHEVVIDDNGDVAELSDRFRQLAVAWGLAEADPGVANTLMSEQQELVKGLRKSAAGRRAIELLVDDNDSAVRLLAATASLAWNAPNGVEALQALGDGQSVRAFDAKTTLREYPGAPVATGVWVRAGSSYSGIPVTPCSHLWHEHCRRGRVPGGR